ncbi:hypothetical protein TUBRATIS_22870, partial [Tubulinosema ratisbonensis]
MNSIKQNCKVCIKEREKHFLSEMHKTNLTNLNINLEKGNFIFNKEIALNFVNKEEEIEIREVIKKKKELDFKLNYSFSHILSKYDPRYHILGQKFSFDIKPKDISRVKHKEKETNLLSEKVNKFDFNLQEYPLLKNFMISNCNS